MNVTEASMHAHEDGGGGDETITGTELEHLRAGNHDRLCKLSVTKVRLRNGFPYGVPICAHGAAIIRVGRPYTHHGEPGASLDDAIFEHLRSVGARWLVFVFSGNSSKLGVHVPSGRFCLSLSAAERARFVPEDVKFMPAHHFYRQRDFRNLIAKHPPRRSVHRGGPRGSTVRGARPVDGPIGARTV